MTLALIIAALTLTPTDDVACESIDRIEINHYYDDKARHVFDQLIFSDWDTCTNRFQVRAWRLIKSPSQLPTRNFISGGYDVIWHDGEVTRHVRAKAVYESWTQHDPEMHERNYLPKEQRRKLFTPRIEAKADED